MPLKYSIEFAVAFSKSPYFIVMTSVIAISEAVRITAKFQKAEFDKYATSGVSAFSILVI